MEFLENETYFCLKYNTTNYANIQGQAFHN